MASTVLDVCRSASLRLVGTRPTTIFSSTGQIEAELADLANETAAAIAKVNDWQALTRLATLQGDGSATAFTLPTDFDRMPVKSDVHSGSWQYYRYRPARDLDQWLDFQTYLTMGVPGAWIILDGQMNVRPAMGVSEQAKFYYVSTSYAKSAQGVAQTAFKADDDTFVLDGRLLTLGLIWRWRAQKRQEYAEDLRNYEIALSEEIGRERGSRVLTIGGRSGSGLDVRMAYPGALGL